MPLSHGTNLGRYEIRSLLGAGGMGEVYLAQDTTLRRQVAIKLLPANLTANKDRLHRFEQEAYAISSLNHPNILTIHEIGAEGSLHFIATELIEGENLRQHIKRNSLELREVLDIGIQIASALSAAHAAGIVHRDIKPENIMIRRDRLAKVLDFGLAKLIEQDASAVDTKAPTKALNRTEPGVVMGTTIYMSPEQARGLEVDARTDIWSLGVMLYEMLAGRRPFEGETASDVIAAILKVEPPILTSSAPDVPAELERIVTKALRKDKEERYQGVKDLELDLKNLKKRLEFEAELNRSAATEEKNSKAERATTGNDSLADGTTQVAAAQTGDASAIQATSSIEFIIGEIKRHKLAALLILATLVAAIAYFAYSRYRVASDKANNSAASDASTIRSIAVLPFVNESNNVDAEYLSDGMTESLINSLSQLPNLSVKARSTVFRYKGKEIEPQQVGSELNVQAILNGRVVQRGDDLALYLSLVDARNGNQLWGEQYNRKLADLVTLQGEIAHDVSNKLWVKLSGADEQKLAKNYTENAEAYQLYLKGRYYWYKFPAKEFEKSRDYYQQAIDVDPNYALAYAGLAEYYGFGAATGFLPPTSENWSKSEAAANKALALDDALPDAYNALAGVKQFNNDDSAGAERDLRRAIELNPSYAEGRNHYAAHLINFGRLEEALAQMRKGLELEPLSVPFNRNLAMTFYQTRQYDRAIEQYQKTLELDPNDAYTHELLGDTYEQKGMQKEAVAEWSRALRLTGDNESATMLERTFA
ncbi:MAG: protein kinase, partial [Acidobacteria bacterium]|nr:protein kinase [Acidobacteriota bacterium]